MTAGPQAIVLTGVYGVGKSTTAAQIADLLLAMLGTGLGVLRSMRGERFQTWTPASSIRGGAK